MISAIPFEPTYLFHGTRQPIIGDSLLPAPPFGDVGDPKFPVVFASDLLDFAALFSAKSAAATHLSAGSFFPYLIINDGHPDSRDVDGKVFVIENRGFSEIVTDGSPTGRWWTRAAVPIAPRDAIIIGGRRHLTRLGAVFVHVLAGADANRPWADEVRAALVSASTADECWAALDRFVDSGGITFERSTRVSRSFADFRTRAYTTPVERLEAFFDDSVCPLLPMQSRLRVVHGADHGCRTAILCRVLHNLLVMHGLMHELAEEDLAALMAAAFFHDVNRELDFGPDTSATRSADFTHASLRVLGFTIEQADAARDRIANEHRVDGHHDLGAAILQTADTLELMRNYAGEIWLANTRLFRLLYGRHAAALGDLMRVAQLHAAWLRRQQTFGFATGRVLGPASETVVQSHGPEFDATAICRRNFDVAPFRQIRATLGEIEELESWYLGRR
jgi:hypothetical protein